MLLVDDNGIKHFDIGVGDVIEHYGIKGMKWGQRRTAKLAARYESRGYSPEQAQQKALNRRKWEKRAIKAGLAATAAVVGYQLLKNRTKAVNPKGFEKAVNKLNKQKSFLAKAKKEQIAGKALNKIERSRQGLMGRINKAMFEQKPKGVKIPRWVELAKKTPDNPVVKIGKKKPITGKALQKKFAKASKAIAKNQAKLAKQNAAIDAFNSKMLSRLGR